MDILKNKYFNWLVIAGMAMLILFLAGATINQLKKSEDTINRNLITVTGSGEAVAVPDIATFSFSVTKEAKTAEDARKLATDAANKILDSIKKNDVDDKDIKTTNYNLYPRYDYTQTICPAIYPSNCPPSREVLRGYEINQSYEVKVRDIENASKVVSDATTAGATNINGLTFEVDNDDEVVAKARNEAISEAKRKAESIADGLGVRLVRIVSFNENENGYPSPMMSKEVYGLGGADSVSSLPQLPTGENKYSRTVQITYEIR